MKLRSIAFLLAFFCLLSLVVNMVSADATQQNNLIPLSSPVTIDREIFWRSIPSQMVTGQTYRAVVVVTNTGNEPANFFIDLTYPYRGSVKYFYSSEVWTPTYLTLEPGVSQRIEFAITPLIEHVGELEIEARIFLVWPTVLEPIDSVSATVREIKTVLPTNLLFWAIGFLLLAMFLLLAAKLWKRPRGKLDLLIAFSVFMLALLPRILSATVSSLHVDENGFWLGSYIFLNNEWRWPIEFMMSGYPPLFYYLLAGITFLFGSSLAAIRTISIVSGSMTVVVLYFLAKSLFGRKVGLTSALLLGFSSYHILYSGIATTDSLMIFLILLSVYFFWIGWQGNALKYFAASGLVLGLAFDVKYVGIFVIPAVILFVAWIKRSLRPLLERKILVWAVSFLITISPVQLAILSTGMPHPIFLYLQLAFGPRGLPMQSFHPIQELIPRGFRMFLYPMARAASPWLPWLIIFEVAIGILFFVAAIYYLYGTLQGRPSESFILIFMVGALSLLIDPVKHAKWPLYSFPFFFIMISNIVIYYTRELKAKVTNSVKIDAADFFRMFTIFFCLIFVFSSIFVGVMSPIIDQGEFAGLRSSLLFIKSKAHPNDIIVGFSVEATFYYINSYDLEITGISLAKKPKVDTSLLQGESFWAQIKLNDQLLRALKPRFIIENRMYFDYWYNVTTKEWIFENYNLAFFSWPPVGYRWIDLGYQDWLVFERKGQ